MIGQTRSERRQVIPRWRTAAATVHAGEAQPLYEHVDRPWLEDSTELHRATAAWAQRPTLSRAVELMAAALLYRKPELGIDAARSTLENSQVGELPRSLAHRLLADLDPTDPLTFDLPGLEDERQRAQQVIGRLRAGLRRNPRNALAWLDLAHAQATLGHINKADRSMSAALSLGPANRVLLRSASRLYVHREEADRAHALVVRADLTPLDPWLVAAELATASVAGRSPKLTRQAKKLLSSDDLHPFHLTELSSALATLELEAGNHRRARQLFRGSLTSPTDNSLAQAEWAAHRVPDLEVPHDSMNTELAYEARARHASSVGNWDSALLESWNWLKDQPFSSEPAIFGSYVASVGMANFEEAERIARAGLLANPGDSMLRNNLVFALANQYRLDEAEDHYRRIDQNQEDRVRLTLLATAGLLRYRRGDIDEGRTLYHSAIALAKKTEDRRAIALASIFLAREEVLSRSPTATATLRDVASARTTHLEFPEIVRWVSALRELVGDSDT